MTTKEVTAKKEEKLAELLVTAEAHPMMKAIMAEREEEILQTRKEAAERIEGLREEASRVLPELQSEEDRAREAVAAHDEQRKMLLAKVAAASTARTKERLRIERETAVAEAVLLGNYPEQIVEAIQFFRDMHEKLLVKTIDKSTHAGGTNPFTMTREMFISSNVESIRACLRYCLTSIAILEGMRLEPELDLDRIETLKRGIPDIGEMTEFQRDKPLPPASVDPLRLLPSAEQENWRLARLTERFKRLMGQV